MATMPTNSLTTPELRHRVRSVLRQIEGACHRPLFEEVRLNQDSAGEANASLARESLPSSTPALGHAGAGVGGREDAADVGGRKVTEAGSGDAKKRQLREISPEKRKVKTWAELLNEASTLLPYMTPEEHALASRLASILFLGYALPHSTGEDMYLSRNYAQKRARKDGEVMDRPSRNEPRDPTKVSAQSTGGEAAADAPSWDPLGLDLEEFLETCTRVHAAHDYGEIGCISDEKVTASLRAFLRHGLGPFLAGRPSHATETDLVHVLAMAVSPVAAPPKGGKEAPPIVEPSPSRARAERLMACLHSHYFNVNYTDRAEIVNVLADNFAPPEFESVLVQQQQDQQLGQGGATDPMPHVAKNADSPLFDGALPHLRASLEAFAAGALSNQDVQTARRALVNIAIYSSNDILVTEELNALVAALLDDRTGCRCLSHEESLRCKGSADNKLNVAECQYRACGHLLQDCITRYNGSRHYADGLFTRKALELLSRGLGKLVQDISPGSDVEKDQARTISACQLSSLLGAARTLFYFLLPPKASAETAEPFSADDQFADAEEEEEGGNAVSGGMEQEEGRKEEGEAKNALITIAIRLLNHPDVLIVRSASKLLSLAFAYSEKECWEHHVKSTFVAVRSALRKTSDSNSLDLASLDRAEKCRHVSALQAAVATLSRLSPDFADATVAFLVKQKAGHFVGESILYLISSIALSQPRVVAKHLDELDEIYGGNRENGKEIQHLIATFLSCRLAYFFSSEESAVKFNNRATALMREFVGDPWSIFQLARHAFCTANFGLSAEIFSEDLVKRASSEQTYLWLTSISKTARAEFIISDRGALGIPEALPFLQSSISHICSLSSLYKRGAQSSRDFSFQLQLLHNRVDFLNLCVTARGLCAEMRLSNTGAGRGTRTQLHQRNAAHCFYALASRYAKLYREYGLLHCQQTRTTLRTLHALCRFMASAAAKVFSEAMGNGSRLHKFHEGKQCSWPKGDALHPVRTVIDKFREGIIDPMTESVEPTIRAAAFMEILDSVLRSPLPTPKGFFVVKSPPLAQMRMFANPSSVASIEGTTHSGAALACNDEAEIVEVPPGTQCTVYATGTIPEAYSSSSDTLSFSQVIWWYSLAYDGPLLPDDEPFGEEQQGLGLEDNEGNAFNADEREFDSEEQETLQAVPLQPGGRFVLPVVLNPIQREGYYMLKVTLGCRDVRCGEFEIRTRENAGVICLCVSSPMAGD